MKVPHVAKVVTRKGLHLVGVLFMVSLATFMLLQLTPGNPGAAILGPNATPEAVEAINQELGVDRPVLTQYREWISGAVRGDLGRSFTPPGGPVTDRIERALPITLELAVLAVLMALVVAVPVAIWSAYRQGGLFDRIASGTSFALISVPSFVAGLVLVLLLTVQTHAFPRAEWVRLTESPSENLRHAFLPALALSLSVMATYVRVLRADLIETLQEEFVWVARAKGLATHRILIWHALRPSLFSLVTVVGVSFGYLLGGTVIVEVIFGLEGMGSLLRNAVSANDYPLVQGVVLVIAAIYVLVNLAVDLSYPLLDPRTRRVHP